MSCDVKCMNCKHFIYKMMLNGFDGYCEKQDEFTRFGYKCDDFSYGRNKIYDKNGEDHGG